MKLYGLAVSCVPKRNTPSTMQLTCTPIYVASDNPKKFEIVDRLEPKDKDGNPTKIEFDLTNTREVMSCFVQLVDMLEELVKLQTESCNKAKVPYQAVPLHLGEDGRNPTNLNALYMQLFGERIFPFRSDEEIQKEATDYIQSHDTSNDPALIKHKVNARVALRMAENETFEPHIEQVREARKKYLESVAQQPPEFINAYKKLARLMEQCTLKEGSFNFSGKLPHIRDFTPTEEDQDLMMAKSALRDPEVALVAHDLIKTIAIILGRSWGENVTRSPRVFGASLPEGYSERADEFPSYSFFKWDPEYRDAFERGFAETYQGPHTRNFKLFGDAPNPPFSDIAADRIRDQHQVREGRRVKDAIIDLPEVRNRILNSSVNIAAILDGTTQEPTKTQWVDRTSPANITGRPGPE